MGYSPWGGKGSDSTEHGTDSISIYFAGLLQGVGGLKPNESQQVLVLNTERLGGLLSLTESGPSLSGVDPGRVKDNRCLQMRGSFRTFLKFSFWQKSCFDLISCKRCC